MRKLLINLTDEDANLLEGEDNKSETLRQALRLYKSDISTDTLEGFRVAFTETRRMLKEMDSKLDYIARSLK